MSFPQQNSAPLAGDRVHQKMLALLGGLMLAGWRYVGYRVTPQGRDLSYTLRFERGIVDRLAYCEIPLSASALGDANGSLIDFLTTKLNDMEAGLALKRQAKIGLN